LLADDRHLPLDHLRSPALFPVGRLGQILLRRALPRRKIMLERS
jgi:hypothetical protein